jgi:ubiquitin-conjugating enzyme E2 O
MNEKTDEKYQAFKKFYTVDGYSDHYYSKPELRKVQIVKKV